MSNLSHGIVGAHGSMGQSLQGLLRDCGPVVCKEAHRHRPAGTRAKACLCVMSSRECRFDPTADDDWNGGNRLGDSELPWQRTAPCVHDRAV